MANVVREVKKKVREAGGAIGQLMRAANPLCIAAAYHGLIVVFVIVLMLAYHDKYGFGLILIPPLVIIAMAAHCVTCFFKRERFKTGLFAALHILKLNVYLFFADGILIAGIGSILDKFGVMP